MSKYTLPFLEIMITQDCNLNCLGCSNYSDLPHNGYLKWKDGKKNIQKWLQRVDILDFGIMGGEPLLNPEVNDWLIGTRELLPNAQIRFTTNGLLLHRHFDIINLMHDLGNISFKVTVHKESKVLTETINKIFNLYKWETVCEYGIERYITSNNFRFHVKRPTTFVKTYRNSYTDMLPWKSNYISAFENCVQQTCPLIVNDTMYKCSTSGLLESTLNQLGNPNIEQWKEYIPNGIGPDCSDNELEEFLENFGKPNYICSQCPDKHSNDFEIDHLSTVN